MERALLQSLVDFLSYRGPDSHECGMDASIGLGHAMLRTTRQSRGERQPASLDDGRFWITADARLDGRVELITELERSGRIVQPNAPGSELILHAYAAWGTPSVEHLRGDFSFAIWDAHHKQLFCARDHFGIKPFYYLEREDLFLFSNTLNCIRMHPEVSGELNEAAIGDFQQKEPKTRTFGATRIFSIRSLPTGKATMRAKWASFCVYPLNVWPWTISSFLKAGTIRNSVFRNRWMIHCLRVSLTLVGPFQRTAVCYCPEKASTTCWTFKCGHTRVICGETGNGGVS